jgi:hypothetical protein
VGGQHSQPPIPRHKAIFLGQNGAELQQEISQIKDYDNSTIHWNGFLFLLLQFGHFMPIIRFFLGTEILFHSRVKYTL